MVGVDSPDAGGVVVELLDQADTVDVGDVPDHETVVSVDDTEAGEAAAHAHHIRRRGGVWPR